jgi:hypothetical protein
MPGESSPPDPEFFSPGGSRMNREGQLGARPRSWPWTWSWENPRLWSHSYRRLACKTGIHSSDVGASWHDCPQQSGAYLNGSNPRIR